MILDDKSYIAKKIKEYRIASGMTQAELAEKIDISTKQVSRIEVGDFYPSLGTFLKIAEALNMDLSDFVTPNPQSENKIRQKLINRIYSANDEELNFYDRILTFASDEASELKKNLLLKRLK